MIVEKWLDYISKVTHSSLKSNEILFDVYILLQVICKLYTGLSFYFFMSVFTWMFVEGVHLYQMIVIAFVSRSMMKFYVALGWGKFNLLPIHRNFRAL